MNKDSILTPLDSTNILHKSFKRGNISDEKYSRLISHLEYMYKEWKDYKIANKESII